MQSEVIFSLILSIVAFILLYFCVLLGCLLLGVSISQKGAMFFLFQVNFAKLSCAFFATISISLSCFACHWNSDERLTEIGMGIG